MEKKEKGVKLMIYLSADHHFGHFNIIKFCNRPFTNLEMMEEELIRRHNEVVTDGDVTIFAGDFCWRNKAYAEQIIRQLKGQKVFLRGSHDAWMGGAGHEIWEKTIDGQHVVVCHYCMRTWGRGHYGSWQLYAHSHGNLKPPTPVQMDIGVDTNNYYPYSFEDVKVIIKKQLQEAATRKLMEVIND